MNADNRPPARPQRLPQPDEIRNALGYVPLIEAYFRRARAEMPDDLRAIFQDHGLTARHGGVLPQLLAEPGLTVGELARRMGVSLPTASGLVADLARAGLVERREAPDDRRRILLSLAEGHATTVERYIALRAAPLLRVLDGLPPDDRHGFMAGLAAWAGEMRDG